MPKFPRVIRSLRRHGLASLGIVGNRAICGLSQKLGVAAPFSHKHIALAATKIYRWQLAQAHWDKTRIDVLNGEELLAVTTSLLRNKRWQDAANVAQFATSRGLGSIRIELARTEALWQLKDKPAFEASREAAISYLQNPTDAELSLIRNENQVVNITSRLELLWMTQRRIDRIRQIAHDLPLAKSAKAKAFVYWDTGFENAPEIVRACVTQLRKVYGKTLVELNAKNIDGHLNPEPELKRVAKLWPANYSDAIRVGLLASHGGLWLDSTVYTTENSLEVRDRYLGGDLFVFNYNGPRIASWFMMAKTGSYQARLLYAAMLDYWQTNRKLKNYFLFHDFFEVLYHLDPKFRQDFDRATKISASKSNTLGRKLLWEPFNEQALAMALQEQPVQKLTYKTQGRNTSAGTLFDWLTSSAQPRQEP